MTKNRYQRAFFQIYFFVAIFFFAQFSFADKTNDFYIQQALAHYFILPTEVRSLSMGGSTEVSCHNASCLYLNPAGLANLTNTELTLSINSRESTGDEFLEQNSIEEVTKDGYIVLATPLKLRNTNLGVLSLAYSRYQGKVNDRISTTPDGYRLSGGYGYDLELVRLGYSLTFYDDQLHTDLSDLHSHSRFLHVFGVQRNLTENLTAGLTFQLGIGQSDTEEIATRRDGLSHLKQYTGSFGLSQKIDRVTLAGSFDYTHVQSRGNLDEVAQQIVIGRDEDGDVYGIHGGAEVKVTDELPLRIGMRWYRVDNYDFDSASLSDLSGGVNGMGYSAGIGYVIKLDAKELAKLDYGAEYFTAGHGAWQHVLTLSVPLNL